MVEQTAPVLTVGGRSHFEMFPCVKDYLKNGKKTAQQSKKGKPSSLPCYFSVKMGLDGWCKERVDAKKN